MTTETVYVPVADGTPQAAAEAFAEALNAVAASHGQPVVFAVRPQSPRVRFAG